MPTTDHTLEYRHFEGILEVDQEGAGPKMVWEISTYVPERERGKRVREEVTDRAEAEAEIRASTGSRHAQIPALRAETQGIICPHLHPRPGQKRGLALNPRTLMAIRKPALMPTNTQIGPTIPSRPSKRMLPGSGGRGCLDGDSARSSSKDSACRRRVCTARVRLSRLSHEGGSLDHSIREDADSDNFKPLLSLL